MKKLLTVLLVLCLVLTVLSAKVKVGAEVGYGVDLYNVKMSFLETSYTLGITNKGLAANLVGEYGFNDNFALKGGFGVMLAGKAKMHTDAGSETETAAKESGIYFDGVIDAKYSFHLNEKSSFSVLGGIEATYGLLVKGSQDAATEKKLKNLAVGANLGLEFSYMVVNNLNLNVGVSGSWFFVNTSDVYKLALEAEEGSGTYNGISHKISSFYIRPYAGVTYAF